MLGNFLRRVTDPKRSCSKYPECLHPALRKQGSVTHRQARQGELALLGTGVVASAPGVRVESITLGRFLGAGSQPGCTSSEHLMNRRPQLPTVSFYKRHLLFFSFWLTSLCMTDSRSIHLTTNNSVSFLFMASNIPLYICATSSLSISLSMGV